MQKQVSKQNLAIVALSIILTLAIALSFTFAAITGDQKVVKGVIEFNGAIAIQVNNATEATPEAGDYTFAIALSTTTTQFDTATFAEGAGYQLAANSASGFIRVTAVLGGDDADEFTLTANTFDGYTAVDLVQTSDVAITTDDAAVNFDDLFSVKATDGTTIDGTEDAYITFTINAQSTTFTAAP